MLFSGVQRTDASPKRAVESDFAFLDRSAWAPIGAIRAVLEAYLANYPAGEVKDLIARFQCGDDRHFASASFELVLHEYLLRLGMRLTPHPELPNGSTKRPDFLIECPDGQQLYLEVVSASDKTNRDPAAEAMKEVALQVLDDAYHPDFFVAVDSQGDPRSQPSGRRLASVVLSWLNTLDSDGLLRRWYDGNGFDPLPEFQWQHEEWVVRIRPIPVDVEKRGKERRLIGTRGLGGGFVDGWTPIRDAVQSKAQRYGDLALPLVVAVNVNTFKLSPIDEEQALFGQEQIMIDLMDSDREPRLGRAPNGAWAGPEGVRGKRGSGAWFFDNLSPYALAKRRRQTLYVHPEANHLVPDSFLTVPHRLVVDGRLRDVDGTDLATALRLPRSWPE